MNKSEISIEDLQARVLSFIEKAKSATENIEFKVDYTLDKNISFSSLYGMNIFRVIQEAVNNAIKYSEASKIDIQLSKKENNFIVSISDNGIGFDLKNIKTGNGLSNIERRMSEINGSVKINSKIDNGTRILLKVAIENTANDV